ncbi:hypothetical protein HMI54_009257 [Coelomomyces lativittatus]|nr:hypothetical protein HMI54_009257 [Coelomomyces lativittatus]KAJ1512926.1 hypothetical protein HMI55_006053 [Coelomomyces lativittatus]KAJ1515535.1 hypothetical protein HMI56_003929 [Coelomomyces lativittatus]
MASTPITPSEEDAPSIDPTLLMSRYDRNVDRNIELIHTDFFNDFGDLFDEAPFRQEHTPSTDVNMVVTPE